VALAGYDLTEGETASLKAIDFETMDSFAGVLDERVSKRMLGTSSSPGNFGRARLPFEERRPVGSNARRDARSINSQNEARLNVQDDVGAKTLEGSFCLASFACER
jgi:hypothetical protein